MSAYGKGMLVAVVGIGAMVTGSMLDRGVNYTPTEAVVTSAKVDCFIKNGNRFLAERATDEMAYMECDLAKLAAASFGYSEKDIKKRTQLKFKFKAVDGSQQTGEHTEELREFAIGQKITIYRHKSDPTKMRWS